MFLQYFLKKNYFCLLNFNLSIFINSFTIIAIYIDNCNRTESKPTTSKASAGCSRVANTRGK